MFKAVILTNQIIKHPLPTLNRRIISSMKYEVKKSPEKLASIIEKQSQQLKPACGQQGFQRMERDQKRFRMKERGLINGEIEGELKLFHEYELYRNEQHLNQEGLQRKRDQRLGGLKNNILEGVKTNILGGLRTNLLGIVNLTQLQKQKTLRKLQEIQEQIQRIDLFKQREMLTSNECEQRRQKGDKYNKYDKQVGVWIYDLVVEFKNDILCEQFYKISYKQLSVLPVYLKEIIILLTQNPQQISYSSLLKTLNQVTPINHLQINNEDNQVFQFKSANWIQLPKCVNCLLKLEFQVSGIQQKVLYKISQIVKQGRNRENKVVQKVCHTCNLLEQHRKFSDYHRKLSYEQGYKEHNKSQKHAHCDHCKEKSDIWICMVCGSVGCGRYKNGDAYKHFVRSGHMITIDLQTERVWNYLSDCFSHKILKTFSQVKGNVKFPDVQGESVENSKLEGAFWQYCTVFSEEMERQRVFYQKITRSEEEKFLIQNEKLDMLIKELSKQSEEKSLQLRRSLKKKGKILKRQNELQKKLLEQKQILQEQEECLSADFNLKVLLEDEDIVEKKKELQRVESELNQILMELSAS